MPRPCWFQKRASVCFALELVVFYKPNVNGSGHNSVTVVFFTNNVEFFYGGVYGYGDTRPISVWSSGYTSDTGQGPHGVVRPCEGGFQLLSGLDKATCL